ncbi:hypothetical protein TNCV_2951721 [Trichonephila clavipes]|nr:hypothetical protein TNCV_2951721 [Trichonephila clavipes]
MPVVERYCPGIPPQQTLVYSTIWCVFSFSQRVSVVSGKEDLRRELIRQARVTFEQSFLQGRNETKRKRQGEGLIGRRASPYRHNLNSSGRRSN